MGEWSCILMQETGFQIGLVSDQEQRDRKRAFSAAGFDHLVTLVVIQAESSSSMALLQPKLNLKVAQRQVLTPGLMQMVSVLALNKLELKEMIDAEMVENPVLEEIDESVPMLDQVAGREEKLERPVEEATAPAPKDIRLTKSISDRTFRSISTPAIAPSRNMKRAKNLRLRIFFRSRRPWPITWRGSWEL